MTLDSIEVKDGRYVVHYTPTGFDPKIDESDASQFHVHFFWDVWAPQQAGTNASTFGASVGTWQIWDQPVFDKFTVAERPSGASRICAVVGTHVHGVDNPTSFDRISLPR